MLLRLPWFGAISGQVSFRFGPSVLQTAVVEQSIEDAVRVRAAVDDLTVRKER